MNAGVLLALHLGVTVALCLAAAAASGLVVGLVVREVVCRHHLLQLRQTAQRLGSSDLADIDEARTEDLLTGIERSVARVRHRAAEASDAMARLQQALDTLPQAVLIMDAAGVVVERNTAAETFIAARHADALVEVAVGELVESALRGEPASRTLELFGPPRRVVAVTTAPLESAAGSVAVAVIDDITERYRLEAVRTDFVANISHELKTPVGAIGLLAETLQAEDEPSVAARLAARIQAEALRVGHTIEDLLQLSRIELGQVGPGEEVVIDDVVLEAVDRIRPAAGQAGISVDAAAVPEELVVVGDRRQLISALSNLLDNAVKYSDAGGSIELGASAFGHEVVLTVADHGIGIPSRDMERIFERFYRVDQARSRLTGGTGLGLAIVRHVAANHHGSVEVESRLGEGSRFTLRLPATRPQTADAPTVVGRPPITAA